MGDRWSIAYALADLVNPVLIQGNSATAYSLAEESLRLFRSLGDKRGITYALRRLTDLSFAQANYVQVQRLTEESLPLFGKVGDREDIALSLILPGRPSSSRATLRELAHLRRKAWYSSGRSGVDWVLSNRFTCWGA